MLRDRGGLGTSQLRVIVKSGRIEAHKQPSEHEQISLIHMLARKTSVWTALPYREKKG